MNPPKQLLPSVDPHRFALSTNRPRSMELTTMVPDLKYGYTLHEPVKVASLRQRQWKGLDANTEQAHAREPQAESQGNGT